MNIAKVFICFSFVLIAEFSVAQTRCKIRYLRKFDPSCMENFAKAPLVDTIVNFIKNVERPDNRFKKLGYVKLNINPAHQNRCFSLEPSFYYFSKKDNDNLFPVGYLKIKNRYVLFYNQESVTQQIRTSKKRRFVRRINRSLPVRRKIRIVGTEGQTMILKSSGLISIDQGREYCVD